MQGLPGKCETNEEMAMSKIVYFDYCALVIYVILILSLIMRRMTKSRANKIFLSMIGLCILTTISDIVAVHLDMSGSGYVVGKLIFHTSYLFLHSLLSPLYIIYVIIRTDTWYKFCKSRPQQLAIFGPVVALGFLLILNLFWPVVYYLDANDTYTRGDIFGFLYFLGMYYAVFVTVYLCVYRKTVTQSRFVALMALVPVTLITASVQFFFKNALVEMFGNACAIMLIGLMIQKPEERIDSDTGLEKLSAYVADMKRAALLGKPIEIIMINIANYMALQEMLSYDDVRHLKNLVAGEMLSLNKRYKLRADLYYISDGKFRFVVSEHSGQIEDVAKQMMQFLQRGIRLSQMEVHITSRVCIARYPEDIDDVDSLLAFGNDLNRKDLSGELLYASQEYRKEYYDIMKDIDGIIEKALIEHNFYVYYQPIFSVTENRFRSAEALLRLKDEKYGFISPDIFIVAAEKSGAIHKIGEFVLEEVCRLISGDEFKRLGLDYIEVNLSVIQCMQSNLASQVLDILRKFHVRPEQINLEITETAASYAQETIMENLTTLSAAGIYFSLDDFGTGYSNMTRIASMPFYLVKLDKSFTHAQDNPRLMIVLKNTIEMIKSMNMQIVVEGVETRQMVERFSQLQCEYIQGYYYSRPLPQDEFVEFMRQAG